MGDKDATIRTLYISDEAYQKLKELAHEAGAISNPQDQEPDGCHARGISSYIASIFTNYRHHLQDTRPQHIKDMDAELNEAGHASEWIKYTPSRARHIKVSLATLVQACATANALGMSTFDDSRRLKGAPSMFDGPRCLSLILEALGTEWITLKDE